MNPGLKYIKINISNKKREKPLPNLAVLMLNTSNNFPSLHISFRKLFSVIALVLIVVGVVSIPPENILAKPSPYNKLARTKYIDQSLESFAGSSIKLLENAYQYIFLIANTQCRSSIDQLKIACLIEASQQNCKTRPNRRSRQRCEKYSDVLIINKLAEDSFLNRSERYHIMKSETSYHQELLKQLTYRYATLATQFQITQKTSQCKSRDRSCLSESINTFCLKYSNKNELSWQHCSGALIWFIGTSR